MQRTPSHALVLSDLHFGDTRCTLHSMQTARRLVQTLKDYQPVDEIILIGDILDLQLANWAQAVEGRFLESSAKRAVGFRYFLNFLVSETGAKSVIYVPGNHDYRIFEYHSIERHLLQQLRTGKKLSGKVAFFRSFPNSFLQGLLSGTDVSLKVVYPHYSRRMNGYRVILTHGHFFDPTQAFNHEIGKLFARAGTKSAQEKNRMRHSYFKRLSLYQNVISGISMKKELRELFNALYQPVTLLQKSWKHRTRKSFLTPSMRRSIDQYAAVCCRPGRVDGLIFGHTHHAGSAHFSTGMVPNIWNAGTFLRESRNSPCGTFLTLRYDGKSNLQDAVQLHTLL